MCSRCGPVGGAHSRRQARRSLACLAFLQLDHLVPCCPDAQIGLVLIWMALHVLSQEFLEYVIEKGPYPVSFSARLGG